jgi:LSD1 subclass zinc finger protein
MNAQPPPQHLTATADMAGRSCPYCRFPIKPGSAIVRCGSCHAVQHEDCYRDNGGCPVAGCAGGPATAARDSQIPYPPPAGSAAGAYGAGSAYRGTQTPGAPPETPGPKRGPTAATVIIATAVGLLVAGGAVAAVIAGQGSGQTSTVASDGVADTATSTSSNTTDTSTATDTVITTTTAPVVTVPPQTSVPSDVTGQDSSGFNIGPGCSDNEQSPLPGCSDAPSVPAGDPEGVCPNGITVDKQTTTCGLALSVQSNYTTDGPVSGVSSKTGQQYRFSCQTGGPGTTGYTICQGQAGSSPLYLRWHK